MVQFVKTLQQMLKFILIIGLAFFHAIALIYTLLIWKPDPKIPFIFLCLSANLFSCLCVDLARDQLQNIAYYPVTNTIFLLTFTLCCIISSMHSLPKKITKYWPLVQLIAFIIYILHEEYIIRQILYRILQLDNSLKGFILVICGLFSCVIAHFGCGTVMKLLLEGSEKVDKQLRNINQEIQSMIKSDSLYDNEQNLSHNIYRDTQIAHIQQKNYLQTLITSNEQFPQILKASLILGPPLFDLLSFILQFLSAQANHNHFHQHIHHYFSQQGLYFQDLTSQSVIGMFVFSIRIISSAIVFHTIFKIWAKQIDKINKSVMKQKYKLAVLGFAIAVGRMLAQRM